MSKTSCNILIETILNSVRKTPEGKVSDFHWRDHIAINTFRLTHSFDVIQHNNRAFVKAEVFNGVFDLAIFNVESTVSG